MIIYAVRGLIIVKASQGEYAIPMDNFQAKKVNAGVAIYGGVDTIPVNPLATIFKEDGVTNFADTTELYGYLGECQAIARGDASPSAARQETYSGATDSSGNYTVIFPVAFAVAPNIQARVIGGTSETFHKVTSITTTGFTVNVFTRAVITTIPVVGTLPDTLLAGATVALLAANVDVLITEK